MTIINNVIFSEIIEKYDIKSLPLLKKYSFLSLRIGFLCRYFKLPFGRNIDKRITKIADDIIIVFDGGIKNNDHILDIIARENEGKRLIFYYWNPIWNSIQPQYIPAVYEKWTYSYADSLKYHILYNPQFYFSELCKSKVGKKDRKWDVVFVGKDKGRKKQLQFWKNIFEQKGLSINLYIIASHPRVQKLGYKKSVSYNQVIDLAASSKCILDFYIDVEAGLSLRVMEALFLERKLVTNNITIVNYDFYNCNNIFILGEDDINKLHDFVNTPYEKVDSHIMENYEFSNWIKRF